MPSQGAATATRAMPAPSPSVARPSPSPSPAPAPPRVTRAARLPAGPPPVRLAPTTVIAARSAPLPGLRGIGEPLAEPVRTSLEAGLGADLRAVRVHRGDDAARLAREHGARAFAYGHRGVLGPGESPMELALMAPASAHVPQPRGPA